ncbi:MAG: DEAD/DEAH box helicase family protein, partial [Planctomycetes bacterium]|nr:DEAD/DEAH box helicase family protein [Planctomycetota bacterium]
MLELKGYQRRTLEALDAFFSAYDRLRLPGPAFEDTAQSDSHGARASYRPLTRPASLAEVPYICVRIPTGGGKTLVACHATGIVARALHADFPTILWLVPSTAILDQTRRALANHRHPYASALRSALGDYELLDLEAALYAGRAKYEGGATVLLATVQSFRIDRALLDQVYDGRDGDARGAERVIRRVYSDDGHLMDHFSGLTPAQSAGLEMKDGIPRKTLENVLRLRRPIVFVDEGHNAHTDLSFDTLARFRPSAIVEFTATPNLNPDAPSNVLVSAAAGELKAEAMIKLPIRLAVRENWKALLADAAACRNHLEHLAAVERQHTGEDIRPVMLLQAQPRRASGSPVTVDVLVETLRNDHRVAPEEIVVATGGTDELARLTGKPDCLVRYVITVSKLREGWDCPAAYVLYSVAASRSETAVEQVLGRVMRLPGATVKQIPALNEAHAFVASPTFQEAATGLCDGLVRHGFNPYDARSAVRSASPLPSPDANRLGLVYTVDVPPEVTPEAVPAALRLKVAGD